MKAGVKFLRVRIFSIRGIQQSRPKVRAWPIRRPTNYELLR